MTKCCIRGCNSNSREKSERLSFFRFPKNEALRKLWLRTIGSGNIRSTEIIRICSKHFEENCVNKTLDVIRLKDDVVPTLFPYKSFSVPSRMPLSMNTDNITIKTELLKPMQIDIVPVDPLYIEEKPNLTSMNIDFSINTEETLMILDDKKPLKVQKLVKVVDNQRKKIKVLNQKCRRLTVKVHKYRRIIEELKSKNLVPHEDVV